jgi:hypothetical protein
MPPRKKRPLRWYEDYHPTDPRLWLYGPVPAGFWRARDNRQLYMEWLGEQLGVRRLEDWYQLSLKTVRKWRGGGLLDYCGASPFALLKDYRPDYEWQEWRLRNVPLGFWQHRANRRRYLDWLGQQLGFAQPEDWYQLSKQHLEERHGRQLLALFRGSPCAIVKDALPQYRWLEWRFRQVRQGFWDVPANRQRYMRWLGKQLGFRRVEDWYQVTQRHFEHWEGGGLLAHFASSPSAVVKDYRPTYPWLEWRFVHVPVGFWGEAANRRRYMDWLGQHLGFRHTEDWYRLTFADLFDHSGARLLTIFGDSPSAVLRDYRPDYDWKEWLFRRPTQGFWARADNRCRYLDWLGHELGFATPEDWTRLRSVDVSSHRGRGLLNHFHHDLAAIVHEYLTLRSRPRRTCERAASSPPHRRPTKRRTARGADG